MALTARKIAVTVYSRQHQGISVPKDKKIRTVFVAQYGSDVFCSEYTSEIVVDFRTVWFGHLVLFLFFALFFKDFRLIILYLHLDTI